MGNDEKREDSLNKENLPTTQTNTPSLSYSGFNPTPELRHIASPTTAITDPYSGAHPMMNLLKHMPEGAEVSFSQHQYRSPFPPPEIIEHYKEIDPRLPDAILIGFQEESTHRRQLQSKKLDIQEKEVELNAQVELKRIEAGKEHSKDLVSVSKRGQWIGLFVFLLLFGGACYFFEKGNNEAGYTMLGTTATGVVAIFVSGVLNKKNKNDNVNDKNSQSLK